jgi:hypothetical protein
MAATALLVVAISGTAPAQACHSENNRQANAAGCVLERLQSALEQAPGVTAALPRMLLSKDEGASSLASVAVTSSPAGALPDARRMRVQTHGNGLRGLHYYEHGSGSSGSFTINMRPILYFQIDGDPTLNAQGALAPIDVDGDGTYEYVHFNGFRFMRVYRANGVKLWQVNNPGGRVHRGFVHRDTLIVWDFDGDGRQEIAHCWVDAGTSVRKLVIRDGATGRELRSVALPGEKTFEDCQMGGFYFEGDSEISLLVSHRAPASASCTPNLVDYFTRVVAFDPRLNLRWSRTTCQAGHYVWPVDEDRNGYVEAVLAGKYKLDKNGTIACTLEGMGNDHVDSAAIADIDPALPGFEMVSVSQTGTRFHRTGDCSQRWWIPISKLRDPQHIVLARYFPNQTTPTIVIRQRATEPNRYLYFLNAAGDIIQQRSAFDIALDVPFQNANIDGATGRDEVLSLLGVVGDWTGGKRLDVGWYWNLQHLTPEEEQLHRFDQWTAYPYAFDVTGDGRDEIIVWGRHVIAVGQAQ